MSEIILWSLLAFFGAFGLVEFVRFVYTDWSNSSDDFHVVIRADKVKEKIEAVVRNTILATDTQSIIVLSNTPTDNESVILEKLQEKHSHIEVMKTEDYIDYLKK